MATERPKSKRRLKSDPQKPIHQGNEPSCRFLSLPATHCCTIVESVSEGVFTIDPEKRITYLNPAAEKITGFSAAEAVGQNCFDIFRADICARNCPLETALVSGQPHMNLRAFIINKSGARIAVSMNAAPLKDEEGRIIGAVETFQDLSEVEELRRQVSHGYAP